MRWVTTGKGGNSCGSCLDSTKDVTCVACLDMTGKCSESIEGYVMDEKSGRCLVECEKDHFWRGWEEGKDLGCSNCQSTRAWSVQTSLESV